jgi:hypothetical protein
MPGPVSREGVIPEGGVLDLLRELEVERTSGVIRFDVGDGREHEVWLVGGQLALDQPHAPGHDPEDPVELLLGARRGTYRVVPKLPPLPVSQGDEDEKRGSLAVHVPADLLAYCERAGLTGTLGLERPREGGGRPEAVLFVYERGELLAVHGFEGSDVNDAFGWERGSFRIRRMQSVAGLDGAAASNAPAPTGASGRPDQRPPSTFAGATAPLPGVEDDFGRLAAHEPSEREDATVPFLRAARRGDETGRTFLRVVETTLGTIVDEAEKRRSPTRSSPALDTGGARVPSAPPPAALPRASVHSQRPVRILYLSGEVAQPEALRAPAATGGAASPVVETLPGGARAPGPATAGRASSPTSIGATLAAAATVARTSNALPCTIPPEAISELAAAHGRPAGAVPRRDPGRERAVAAAAAASPRSASEEVASATAVEDVSPAARGAPASSGVGAAAAPGDDAPASPRRRPPAPLAERAPEEPAPGLSPWTLLVAVLLVAGAIVVVWVAGR